MSEIEKDIWTTSTPILSSFSEGCFNWTNCNSHQTSTNDLSLKLQCADEWRIRDLKQQLEEEKSRVEGLKFQLDHSTCRSSMHEVDLGREQDNTRILRDEILILEQSLHVLQGQFSAHENETCQTQKRLHLENEFLAGQGNLAREENEAMRKVLVDREGEIIQELASKDKALLDANLLLDKVYLEKRKLESTVEDERRASKSSETRATQLTLLAEQGIKEHTDNVEKLRRSMFEANESISKELTDRIQIVEERASKAELAEAKTFHMLKEQEIKLTACFVQNEENLLNQRLALMGAFQREKEGEGKELLTRLHLVQQQRDRQEIHSSNMMDEIFCLRKTHQDEVSSALLSMTQLREELAHANTEARKEKHINMGLHKELAEIKVGLRPLKDRLEVLENEKAKLQTELEMELGEANSQLQKERDGRKHDTVTLQLNLDKCNDKVQILKKNIQKEHVDHVGSWFACENELIKLIRTTFASLIKKPMQDLETS